MVFKKPSRLDLINAIDQTKPDKTNYEKSVQNAREGSISKYVLFVVNRLKKKKTNFN